MKNLKLTFFSLLAIVALSIFITSCGKEEITEPLTSLEDINQAKGLEELTQLETKISDEATHHKEISISDQASGVTALLKVSTNVNQLLRYYTEDNVKLVIGETEADNANNEDEIATETDNKNFTPLDMNANIVELKLLSLSSSTGDLTDLTAFSFKFEDGLRQALKDYNAGIVLNLEANNSARGTNNVYGRSTRMKSDGSGDGTNAKVRVYYKYNNGNYIGNRYGSFYHCLTSKVTNWGYSCYSAYIYKIYSWNDVVWIKMYYSCGAKC